MTFEEEKAIMTGDNPPALDDCIEAWESACDRARAAEETRSNILCQEQRRIAARLREIAKPDLSSDADFDPVWVKQLEIIIIGIADRIGSGRI